MLASAPGVKLAAIFAPEHGIFGAQDDLNVQNTTDTVTGVPVYSMYGGTDAKKRPPLDVLKTLDAVVFDIQDAGARFYTYPATLGYLLEAAAQTNTEVIVLDRPDPVNGSFVQGPMSQTEFASFTNYHPIPDTTRHDAGRTGAAVQHRKKNWRALAGDSHAGLAARRLVRFNRNSLDQHFAQS